MHLRYHSSAEEWISDEDKKDHEVGLDLEALLEELEEQGHRLEDGLHDESKYVRSPYEMFELRRVPFSETLPYADSPPVLRLFYAYVLLNGQEMAFILHGGDKTGLSKIDERDWYDKQVRLAEMKLESLSRKTGAKAKRRPQW